MMSLNVKTVPTVLSLALIAGCTVGAYKKRADREVYAILEEVEENLFGEASDFQVEEDVAKPAPEKVTPAKILKSRSQSRRLTLPLDEALSYAIKNSREYQTERENLYLSALTLTGERHNFSPRFFGRSNLDYRRLEDGSKQGSIGTDVGVNKALATGGALGITIANDLLRYFTGDPRRSAATTMSLSVVQPLLRGAGREVAAERLTQANRNVVYAVRDYTHFQNTFSVEIVNQYFGLLQSKNVIFNEYNNYLSRKANNEYLSAREDRESPESVDNAEQNELEAKNRYISSVTNYRNSLDRFKVVLGLPQVIDLHLDDEEIERIRAKGAPPLQLAGREAFLIALQNRLPLFNQIDQFEDRKRQVAIAANRLRAELNFVGGASVDNRGGPTDYTKFNFKDVRANVGLQLNLPLDRLNERNEYRATLIAFEAAARTLAQNFDELRNLLDRRIRELEQFRQSYAIQKNAVALAKKRVEGNQLRFEAGTVIFRSLSESQDALIAAQNAETRALVDYLGARLSLLIDLGILRTDEKAFWLSDQSPEISKSQSNPIVKRRPVVDENDRVIPPDELFR